MPVQLKGACEASTALKEVPDPCAGEIRNSAGSGSAASALPFREYNDRPARRSSGQAAEWALCCPASASPPSRRRIRGRDVDQDDAVAAVAIADMISAAGAAAASSACCPLASTHCAGVVRGGDATEDRGDRPTSMSPAAAAIWISKEASAVKLPLPAVQLDAAATVDTTAMGADACCVAAKRFAIRNCTAAATASSAA
ncbi:hypothetical protein Vafri_20342, partial [Volvox africanus]